MGFSTDITEHRVLERFNEQARRYHGRYRETTPSGHSFRIREQRIYELFDKAGGTVLDVGCGPGITVDHLVRQGCRVHGVDLAPEMIAECRRAFGHLDAATFTVGRIEALDFPAGAFDAVICMGVVEYIDDDAAAVREMARVLKPGGIALISLPNVWSPFRLWRRFLFRPLAAALRAVAGKPPRRGMFHREYSSANYGRLLRTHGLEPVEHVYYNFKLVPSPVDEWFPALTVRVTEPLEALARGPLRWLATSLIVKAVRR
jgi:SAM-dependent methyltransferase